MKWIIFVSSCLLACAANAALLGRDSREFDVREYGAEGDGVTSDTRAINSAIEACSRAGGGQVFFPPGRYLSGTVHLRSHIALVFDAGARLVGTTNLAEYQWPKELPNMPEARWGKWHRALILGESVQDIKITGQGTIDGNRVFDPTGEEKMRGPHTILFVNSHHFTVRDISIVDSANYALLFQASDDVDVRRVKFIGGWDGVHFRGAPEKWCRNVNIIGCEFYTGDDCIAGRYWDNVVINGCVINSSCNGIRVIGPITRTIVNNCLFYGPGQQPHRSSGRTNMLSGIILQPGAWDSTQGLMDDVLLANSTMHNVAAPLTIWNKPGNTIDRITVAGMTATGVYRSPVSAESWSEAPITNLVLRNVNVAYTGGGTNQPGQIIRPPGVDARRLPVWAFYGRNVENIVMEDVRFSFDTDDLRSAVLFEDVKSATLDNVCSPKVKRAEKWLIKKNSSVKFLESLVE